MDNTLYSISALGPTLAVADRRGETTFTVTNTSDRALQTEFLIKAEAPAEASWFTVDRAIRDLPPGRVEQVKVAMVAPHEAEGAASFALVAVWKKQPDEFFTRGPAMGVTLEKAAPEPTPKVPWWIFAVAAAFILIVGGGLLTWALWPDATPLVAEVPAVEGLAIDDASDVLEDAGFGLAEVQSSQGSAAVGTVLGQNPRAGVRMKTGTAVQLTVRR